MVGGWAGARIWRTRRVRAAVPLPAPPLRVVVALLL
jgi:hypothetical protein